MDLAFRHTIPSCSAQFKTNTNHKVGSDLQFVDRAGWVSSSVLTNEILGKEKRGAFAVFTSCENSARASRQRKSSVENLQ